jgi:ATP-binding cassette subfamily C protein CydD
LAWLAQRPVIIPGTIAENLGLFGPLTDLQSACHTSGFAEVLESLPDGMNTVLGRGGVGLSLGQRQRLGLARALGSPAPVLLLDEPTSHLDEATEDTVLQGIQRRASEGATVVLVAHRDSVVRIADHVIAVEAQHHAGV